MFKNLIYVIFLFLAISYFKIFANMAQIRDLKEEKENLKVKAEELQKEIKVLKEDLELFKTDPFYLEKVARNELGLVKENEVVVKIERN